MSLTGNQIRQKFLDFFAARGHTPVKSTALIPANDPTLFFTNAGMVPFKDVFVGAEKRPYTRAASSQKCMRVSGKHNDLENVGRTARHHTFFEMLGNFSFGDYFKKDAIALAWEFLTREVGLPKDKLWVTVFREDDEAERLWHQDQGVPLDRIQRMDEKDNFWSMGETGPCGPCSEIIYEQDMPCGEGRPLSECRLGRCDCDRLLEIWNLVFMQFERASDGTMSALPKPSIDTGMGLERLTAILQGKASNYDSDLFTPLLHAIATIVGKPYGKDHETDVSMRVVADHGRATVFLISDGVLPSNEGRGYVLRRIMRRAIRHGKLLGQKGPFFYRLVATVVKEYAGAYPDIRTNLDTITRVIRGEEERFFETLDKGLKLLSEEIAVHRKAKVKVKVLSGDIVFRLYDTFGFPPDLTELIAAENGLTVDQVGFDQAMAAQKDRARAGWKGSGEERVGDLYVALAAQVPATRFLGYETLIAPAATLALVQNGERVATVSAGEFEFVTDQTPFYGEGGGQVGDQGLVSADGFEAQVIDTHRPTPQLFIHQARVVKGSIKTGQKVQLKVDQAVRQPTMRNHTATHVMHAALRKILGAHVRQAGSLVNDKILRFDFTHFEAIPPEVLRCIEDEVNGVILADLAVAKQELSYDEAIKKGALAFFGDKYGERVRVVSVGDYSTELCGGTHLERASEIGTFRITSEGSVAAGVRRIEAVTGEEALRMAQADSDMLRNSAAVLKCTVKELPLRLEKMQAQIKSLEKEIDRLKSQARQGGTVDYLKDAFAVKGVKAVVYNTVVESPSELRQIADVVMDKLGSGIAVVTTLVDGKPNMVVAVSQDLIAKHPANKVILPLLPLISGRGGGKPDRAQAGGTEPAGLSQIQAKLSESL